MYFDFIDLFSLAAYLIGEYLVPRANDAANWPPAGGNRDNVSPQPVLDKLR
jgi:hypothetical protein